MAAAKVTARPVFASIEAAARHIGISAGRIRRWAAAGQLPLYDLGNTHAVVRLSEIARLVESKKWLAGQ